MEKLLSNLKKIIPHRIFLFFQPAYHFLLSFFSALFYGFPSRRLFVIGVTGTHGKTTVVELVHRILEETGAKTASMSSLRFRVGKRERQNMFKMTMPGRFFVQKFLYDASKEGCRYAVLEITSEGIKQFRHRFVWFDAALVTNVAPEHLETHGGLEKYLRAKLDLFWRLPAGALAVINKDDRASGRFAASTAADKVFYSRTEITKNSKSWRVFGASIDKNGVRFEIEKLTVASKLRGEFNFYNILAATALGLSLHVSLEKIARAIGRVSRVPGRMEFVSREPFGVVVDYAHTPDSLRQVYQTLKQELVPPRLICVLGAAGGGRDKWKRPELGRIAATFCDEIILTNEDPYDEEPRNIIDEISGAVEGIAASRLRKILDRREAIRFVLQSAGTGDVVVITGKGAEPWMMGLGGNKVPWDDREVVRQELRNLKGP